MIGSVQCVNNAVCEWMFLFSESSFIRLKFSVITENELYILIL